MFAQHLPQRSGTLSSRPSKEEARKLTTDNIINPAT